MDVTMMLYGITCYASVVLLFLVCFFSLPIVPCTRLTVQQGPSCDGVWHMCIRSHARHSWCTGWSGHTTETVNIHRTYTKWHSTAQPISARCLDPVSHTHGASTRGGGGKLRAATHGPRAGCGTMLRRCICDTYVYMYIYIYSTHISRNMRVYVCVRERKRGKETVCVCLCVTLVRTFVFRRRQLSHAFLTVCCCGGGFC